MHNVDDIFRELGGTGAVARMIDVKQSAASEMRRRGSIPVKYWPQLVNGATSAGVTLSNDFLVSLHAHSPEQAA